jgi:hypothetical protein
VFYRLTIAKRIVAACGIALVILSCVQQTHALCRVTGCRPQATAGVTATCDCCEEPAHCQHDCDPADHHPTGVDAVSSCCTNQHAPACPSPNECACCRQLPTPTQSSPVDAGSLLAAIDCICCDSTPTVIADVASSWNTADTPIAHERSIDLCARLCRLLV